MKNNQNFILFIQWDEHYRKMALKQRRGSMAYRASLRQPPTNNGSSSTNSTLQISSVPTNESNRNNLQMRNGTTSVPILNGNSPSTHRSKSKGEPDNDDTSPLNGNDRPMTNSKTMLKSIPPNSTTKKDSLNNEKTSTTCTIQ
jgi:hypothetical protein